MNKVKKNSLQNKEPVWVPSPNTKLFSSSSMFLDIACFYIVGLLTVATHAGCHAFLQSAVLAPVPVVLGDLAVLVAAALVSQLLADRPLEEPLAALAAYGAVVPP